MGWWLVVGWFGGWLVGGWWNQTIDTLIFILWLNDDFMAVSGTMNS